MTELPSLSEPLLTTDDAARLLKVPRSTLYELVRSRGLPHVRVGRGLRFVREDLARWVADNSYANGSGATSPEGRLDGRASGRGRASRPVAARR
jgi:excisionase family DNA binding protein